MLFGLSTSVYHHHHLLLLHHLFVTASTLLLLTSLPLASTTATTIVSIVTVSSTATPTSSAASSSYTDTATFKKSVLNSTNTYRSQHNASDLVWNTTLANIGQEWADKCEWEHSGGSTGENLAEGYLDITSSIDAWGDERKYYDFKKPTGFSEKTGHFTQLVWKATMSVGCGIKECTNSSGDNAANGWYLVCEYYPAGNVETDNNSLFKANVQSETSSSSSSSSNSSSGGNAMGGASHTNFSMFLLSFLTLSTSALVFGVTI